MTVDQTSFHHTGFTVSDLERALDFWCGALGGSVLFRQERDGGYFAEIIGEPDAYVRMAHVELQPGGHRVELFQFERPEAGGHRMRPVEVGFAHVCVATDDLDGVLNRLEAAGGERMSDPVEVDAGVNAGSRAVYVRDPDGHVVEVFEARRNPA